MKCEDEPSSNSNFLQSLWTAHIYLCCPWHVRGNQVIFAVLNWLIIKDEPLIFWTYIEFLKYLRIWKNLKSTKSYTITQRKCLFNNKLKWGFCLKRGLILATLRKWVEMSTLTGKVEAVIFFLILVCWNNICSNIHLIFM